MSALRESMRSVLRSTFVISFWTGCSRLLGLLREVLMAQYFGTTLVKGAFNVAFQLPNLFRRLFGEGALSAAFIPVFTRSLKEDGREGASLLGGRMVSLMSIMLGTIVISGVLLLGVVDAYLVEGSTASLVLPMMRIMLPYALFICLVALCMGMLNSVGHFAVPALTPVLLNVVWILTLVLICPLMPASLEVRIKAVAWGVVVAGVIQLAVQIPVLIRMKLRPWPRRGFSKDPRVKRVMMLLVPSAAGMGVVQLNVCIDGFLALAAAPWAAAALGYAVILVNLPLGLFATALGTVLLPTLSAQALRGDTPAMLLTVRQSLCNMLFIMLPAAVGLMLLADPIVRLIYMFTGGMFNEDSAVQTVRALAFYAPGLIVFGIYKVFAPLFYAMEDTRTPVRVAVWMVLLNITLNVASIIYLPQNFRHCGMASATVFCSAVSCVVLAIIMQRRLGSPGWSRVLLFGLKALLAAGVMVPTVHSVYSFVESCLPELLPHKVGEALTLFSSVAAGAAVYLLISVLLHGRKVLRIKN